MHPFPRFPNEASSRAGASPARPPCPVGRVVCLITRVLSSDVFRALPGCPGCPVCGVWLSQRPNMFPTSHGVISAVMGIEASAGVLR